MDVTELKERIRDLERAVMQLLQDNARHVEFRSSVDRSLEELHKELSTMREDFSEAIGKIGAQFSGSNILDLSWKVVSVVTSVLTVYLLFKGVH